MNSRPARKITTAIVGVSAAALLLSACGGSTTTPTASSAGSAAGGSSAPASSVAGATGPQPAESGWCDAVKAQYPNLSGSVGVYSTIVSPEDTPYIEAYKDFTTCTGVTVNYEGSKEFEAQVGVRVASGNPPDLGIFPQPGLLSQIVNNTGAVKPLPDFVKTNAQKYFPSDWLNYGTVNGISFGIPNNADFKSLVWYSPKTFADKGYTVPTTWDELTALTDQIAATGEKPWCIGIASGEATGWQITDWLEEYVLRYAGPEVYDQWVSHDVKFADAPIADALAKVGALLKDPKYVNGGFGDVATIASTQFNDVSTPLLNGQCTFAREAANFDSNFKGKTIGPDGDINAFYFPPANDQFGTTVLGGGTFYAAFADRPEVQAFEYYLTTPEYANARAKAGSWISSNLGLQASSVESAVQQEALKTLQSTDTTFRFDASDLMPAPVGSDAEWKQFTAWITGQDDATTLANIDAAWPTS
ncbi:carbohydrate ABC transporter substrate-binding protein [Nakamurella flavida]|uniref:Carbohydrate ABC transporter substrate-binding protein n=1 Tax=Nakamurella flavida TaxID=363630 RepID=A0A938YLU7_9ACTN|nr:ABC transporter substrate-binding protein [Nakamurella flavida]MBM9477549.1 carbohydrate ABC transporter substrate-binding protein [Nakamurella flavida]MDP9779097.1 alpha-glucoside transport system substrate-binding protein [Nakamurella flavida]